MAIVCVCVCVCVCCVVSPVFWPLTTHTSAALGAIITEGTGVGRKRANNPVDDGAITAVDRSAGVFANFIPSSIASHMHVH